MDATNQLIKPTIETIQSSTKVSENKSLMSIGVILGITFGSIFGVGFIALLSYIAWKYKFKHTAIVPKEKDIPLETRF